MKVTTLEAAMSRFQPQVLHFHAALKRPENTRIKAMRSRCFGSILFEFLNTKPENFFFARVHHAHAGVARRRRRRPVHQGVEDFAHAKVIDGRAKNTGQLAGQEGFQVELIGCAFDRSISCAIGPFSMEKQLVQTRVVDLNHLAD